MASDLEMIKEEEQICLTVLRGEVVARIKVACASSLGLAG
jgi:hypothetical protein